MYLSCVLLAIVRHLEEGSNIKHTKIGSAEVGPRLGVSPGAMGIKRSDVGEGLEQGRLLVAAAPLPDADALGHAASQPTQSRKVVTVCSSTVRAGSKLEGCIIWIS